MPFLSYHTDINTTIKNAGRLICESGVDAVKVEINHHSSLEHILALQSAQIPVIAHIGMTPQSVNTFGGFRVQGRNKHQAEHIIHLAHECSKYGAVAVVIECVPADLAEQITNSLQIPTIGIGAGIGCDGQVLVFNDLVGLTKSPPKFAKCYLNSGELIINALNQYHEDVVALNYPDQNFSFK